VLDVLYQVVGIQEQPIVKLLLLLGLPIPKLLLQDKEDSMVFFVRIDTTWCLIQVVV
jgi:hypothetical protein